MLYKLRQKRWNYQYSLVANYQAFLACEGGLIIKSGARAPGMCGFQIQARGAGARLVN